MDIVFKKITIIDKNENKAKIQKFEEGLNLVSAANRVNGNYTGKSTLLRSLYYTLGADVFFDGSKGWQQKNKYYFILEFRKDDKNFSIIRNDKFFAIFDSQKKKIFSTYNREELSKFYSSFFNATPYLQSRSSKEYKIAAPFALFAFSFLDQLGCSGNSFKSFSNQDEFKDYNTDLILFHLGVNNKSFNAINDSINQIEDKISKGEEKTSLILRLIEKAKQSFDEDYGQSVESLEVELEKYKNEYNEIVKNQTKLQKELYDSYETRSRLLAYINDLKEIIKTTKPEPILNTHKCPLCQNEVNNYTEVFFKRAKANDDYSFQLIDCQSELEEIERKINGELEKYKELSAQIEKIESSIKVSNSKAIDSAKSIGFKQCIESLTSEYDSVSITLNDNKAVLKEKKSELKEIKKAIKAINERYAELLRDNVRRDGITIIDLPNELDVSTKLVCSDNYVFSVVWMNTLNQLKKELNKEGTFFPIVYDNPTNRDFDDANIQLVLKYAINSIKYNKQVIVSKVSFDEGIELPSGINTYEIKLANDKYSLLNSSDYAEALSQLSSLLIEQE